MTLREIRSLVHFSTKDDITFGTFVTLINEACREIQDKRNWSWMEQEILLTIQEGMEYVVLPPVFKEPLRGVHTLMSHGGEPSHWSEPLNRHWEILTKQEALRRFSAAQRWAHRTAYIDRVGGEWRLVVSNHPVNTAFGMRLLAYCYEPKLTLSDTVTTSEGEAGELIQVTTPAVVSNKVTEHLPMAVIEKTKYLVFTIQNNLDAAAASMANFDKFIADATFADDGHMLSGRTIRMGGF